MDNEIILQEAVQTADEFKSRFIEAEIINQPPAAGNEAASAGLDIPPAPPPPAAEDVPGAGKERVFGDEDPAPDTPGDSEIKELSGSEAELKLRFIISMIDFMQAKGYALIAKEMDEQRWRFDEEEIKMLIQAWKPYMQRHGNRIPDSLEPIIVTLWIFGKRAIQAVGAGIKARRNEKLAKSAPVAEAVAAAAAETVDRKKYEIDSDGYYISHPKTGAYVKKADRIQKADLKDIKMLVRDNDLPVLRRAFPTLDTRPYETSAEA